MPRCIRVVSEELTKAGAIISEVTLDSVEILNDNFDTASLADVL